MRKGPSSWGRRALPDMETPLPVSKKRRRPAGQEARVAASKTSGIITRRSLIIGGSLASVVAGATILRGAATLGGPADSAVLEQWDGPADAPVEMISYISFTCGHCATYHREVWPGLRADYIEAGLVRHTTREVAFDQLGFLAAVIARRGGPGRFATMVEPLLAHQSKWIDRDVEATKRKLVDVAIAAGVPRASAESSFDDVDAAENLRGWINRNVARDVIDATPSFIIGGRRYGNMTRPGFDRAIQNAIARSTTA